MVLDPGRLHKLDCCLYTFNHLELYNYSSCCKITKDLTKAFTDTSARPFLKHTGNELHVLDNF